MTLVFGLKDVINVGHGVFISVGVFVGISVLLMLGHMTQATSLLLNLTARLALARWAGPSSG